MFVYSLRLMLLLSNYLKFIISLSEKPKRGILCYDTEFYDIQ